MTASCYESTGTWAIALGIFLTLGTWISYIPQILIDGGQIIKMVRRKSSVGVSPLFMFITNIFSTSEVLNVILLNFDVVHCCGSISFWQCQEMMLPVYQILVMPLNTVIMYVLLVTWYRTPEYDEMVNAEQTTGEFSFEDSPADDLATAPADSPPSPSFTGNISLLLGSETSVVQRQQTMHRLVLIQYLLFMSLFISTSAVALVLLATLGYKSSVVHSLAKSLGIVASVATVIQYCPQIYTTFKLKTGGSLSLLMMLIQAPGAFMVVAFQIGAGSTWTTWIAFLISGILQTVIAIQLAWYDHIMAKCSKKSKIVNDTEYSILSTEERVGSTALDVKQEQKFVF